MGYMQMGDELSKYKVLGVIDMSPISNEISGLDIFYFVSCGDGITVTSHGIHLIDVVKYVRGVLRAQKNNITVPKKIDATVLANTDGKFPCQGHLFLARVVGYLDIDTSDDSKKEILESFIDYYGLSCNKFTAFLCVVCAVGEDMYGYRTYVATSEKVLTKTDKFVLINETVQKKGVGTCGELIAIK